MLCVVARQLSSQYFRVKAGGFRRLFVPHLGVPGDRQNSGIRPDSGLYPDTGWRNRPSFINPLYSVAVPRARANTISDPFGASPKTCTYHYV